MRGVYASDWECAYRLSQCCTNLAAELWSLQTCPAQLQRGGGSLTRRHDLLEDKDSPPLHNSASKLS